MTLLDDFIQAHGIDLDELARLATLSGRHLSRLRLGRSKPTREVSSRIALACSWIVCQKVHTWELFDETT